MNTNTLDVLSRGLESMGHSSNAAADAGRPARRHRDPLQTPVELDFMEDRRLARILEVARDVVLWLGTVFIAAIGVWFVGATVPELRAAVPDHPRAIRAIGEPAPDAGKVREWYLPDVLFNDKAEAAEPTETF
jgi:hypothetical protein